MKFIKKNWYIFGAILLVFVLVIVIFIVSTFREVTFSYWANDKTVHTVQERESLLKILKDAKEFPEGVSFLAYRTDYNDKGELIVEGFIRNKTNSTIFDINGRIVTKTEYLTLAEADFSYPLDTFGKLAPYDSRPVKLIYQSDTVINTRPQKERNKITVETDFKYKMD